MNKLVIVGASGHGKVIADIAEKNGYKEILFLDDNPLIKECGKYSVVGESSKAELYNDADFIIAIGNANIRRKIQSAFVEKGLNIVSLIHPNAVVADTAKIGTGTVIMAGAVINPYTTVGEACIINTCASLDHDCYIGDYCHISVGTHIAGTVIVGENTWIGAGATVINNIEIIADSMIGAGAVVVADIKEKGTYIGVPARRMETKLKMDK